MHMDGYYHSDDSHLRAHIQELLANYVKRHLTLDHVAFTENATEQLFSQSLHFVSLTDANTFVLPKNPFDTLCQSLNLSNLQPYEERWVADADTIKFVKSALNSTSEPRTKSCWLEEEKDCYASLCRPMSPVLTARAIRHSPKLGHGAALASIPRSQMDIHKLTSFETVDIEDICEPAPVSLKVEEVLCIRHQIQPDIHAAMAKILKCIPFMLPSSNHAHINTSLDTFLRCTSPVPELPRCDTPPLFPRNRSAGYDQNKLLSRPQDQISSGLSALTELPAMIPKAELGSDDDKDINQKHMAIVDGWVTYGPSSSPLSLASSSSQVDQLFLHSPPETSPAIKHSLDAEMDQAEIPRARQPGTKPVPSITEGKRIGSFLSPFISDMKQSISQGVNQSKSSPSKTRLRTPLPDDDMDFDCDLNQVYQSVQQEDIRSIIMGEQLDAKDTHLMEVPDLPPPTAYPRRPMFYPTSLRTYVAHPSTSLTKTAPVQSSTDRGPRNFLLKVKGVKPLSLELSWKPFQFGFKVPTDEEVSKVDGTFRDELDISYEYHDDQVDKLLEQAVTVREEHNTNIMRGCTDFGTSPNRLQNRSLGNDSIGLLLTRGERERLSGLNAVTESADQSMSDVSGLEKGPAGNYRQVNSRSSDPPPVQDFIAVVNTDFGKYDTYQSRNRSSPIANAPQPDHISYAVDDIDIPVEDERNLELPNTQLESTPSNPQSGVAHDQMSDHADHGLFLPLSFGSQGPNLSHPAPNSISDAISAFETPCADMAHNGTNSAVPLNTCIGLSQFDISLDCSSNAKHSRSSLIQESLTMFMDMRNKKRYLTETQPMEVDAELNLGDHSQGPGDADGYVHECSLSRSTPAELYDQNTIRLPETWTPPMTLHRYLASMDFIQKRNLVCSLQSDNCAVDLVERQALGDVDLILDPDSAIIFVSLLSLPSQVKHIIQRLEQQTWRFSHVLVIFEAFPSVHAFNSDECSSNRPIPYAYTPPTQKAIKTLRRILDISDAYQSKNTTTQISFAFANSVHEAAVFARHFGNLIEINDPRSGILWGQRDWLYDEEYEGETDLACADGMNTFAAFIMLSQRPLEDILDLLPDARIQEFAPLVGDSRIATLNAAIARRIQDMEMSDLSANNNFLPEQSVVDSEQGCGPFLEAHDGLHS